MSFFGWVGGGDVAFQVWSGCVMCVMRSLEWLMCGVYPFQVWIHLE